MTLSTKLPSELATRIDRMALYRGVSRSYLLRELAEAAVEGRVILGPPPGRHGMTIAELAASEVGRAARMKAQLDAEAACRDARTTRGDAAATPDGAAVADLDDIARTMAARIAEGR